MRRPVAGLLLACALVTGCASAPSWWPPFAPFTRASTASLAKAERLTEEGQYQQAVAAYDEFLAQHADDSQAPRALANRDAIAGFLSARADLARARQDLAAREAEVARLRDELARVRQESERMRADLERLKQIDLRPDRRR